MTDTRASYVDILDALPSMLREELEMIRAGADALLPADQRMTVKKKGLLATGEPPTLDEIRREREKIHRERSEQMFAGMREYNADRERV